MFTRVTLGSVRLNNVSQFDISENVFEIANTARIVIPRNFARLAGKSLLEQFKAGDKVRIEAGYYLSAGEGELFTEFEGYISEIDSDLPVTILCEDATYVLRQTNYVKSYQSATLKQILTDIIPAAAIPFRCDDVNIGRYQIDNASAFAVLQDLTQNFGLYSKITGGELRVGLAFDFGAKATTHLYIIGKNVKKSELKYKRADDMKIRVKVSAKNPNGRLDPVVIAGDKDANVSETNINLPGPMTRDALQTIADARLSKLKFDGYSGSITGFGTPRTHAGDALHVRDESEPEREYRDGKYLIEKVEISYSESAGFSRQNSLGYKIIEN